MGALAGLLDRSPVVPWGYPFALGLAIGHPSLGQAASYVFSAGETSYMPIVRDIASTVGVEIPLVAAVIMRESTWQPNATHTDFDGGKSYGLMQVRLDTAREVSGDPNLSPQALINPTVNVWLGTRYLKKQLDRYRGSIPNAVAAYNAGIARKDAVGRYVNSRGVPSVQAHVDAVLGYLQTYRKGLAAAPPRPIAPSPPAPIRPPSVSIPPQEAWWENPVFLGVVGGALLLALLARR